MPGRTHSPYNIRNNYVIKGFLYYNIMKRDPLFFIWVIV